MYAQKKDHVWTQEEADIWKPKKEASEETESYITLILGSL
jgi:hypothetical protein